MNNSHTYTSEVANLTPDDFDKLGAVLDLIKPQPAMVPGVIRVGSYARFKEAMEYLGATHTEGGTPITKLYSIDIIQDSRVPENRAILVSATGIVMQVYNLDSHGNN